MRRLYPATAGRKDIFHHTTPQRAEGGMWNEKRHFSWAFDGSRPL